MQSVKRPGVCVGNGASGYVQRLRKAVGQLLKVPINHWVFAEGPESAMMRQTGAIISCGGSQREHLLGSNTEAKTRKTGFEFGT